MAPAPSAGERAAARFRHRAGVLFLLRCAAALALGMAALHPALGPSLGMHGAAGLWVPAGLLLVAVAARLLADGPWGIPGTFASLALDAAALTHLLVASGGLFSPLLGTQLLLVAAAALLFASPWALAPALVVPPLAALLQPAPLALADLFLLVWYGSLAVAIAWALRWLQGRDRAAAVAEAALAVALREKAVLGERERISREIHDGVGAALSALVLQTELAQMEHETARAPLAELRTSAEEAIEELRRSVRLLRGNFDPARAAEEHCARFGERTGLAIRFSATGDGCVLAPEAQLTLLRVLQEALSNVARHARASSAAVDLHLDAEGAQLIVRDDGIGFDGGDSPAGHYGLRGMRERARGCGGSLAIRTAAGAGTTIDLQLPPGGRQQEGER